MEGGVSEVFPFISAPRQRPKKIKRGPLEKNRKGVSFPAYRSSFAQHRPPQAAIFLKRSVVGTPMARL